MGLRVSFELDDHDLKHFRLIMREARQAISQYSPEYIVVAAEALLHDIVDTSAPGFILERIQRLRFMIRMLTDLDWRLPHAEATRVLNALAYFSEPEDLIPDHIPGVGFLDDAIMIELVAQELKHEIEAYQDFCDFRRQRGDGKKSIRDSWLEERRAELQERMRDRRNRDSSDALRLFD